MATSKYKNKKITVDGIVFDSIVESEFYIYLKETKIEFEMQKKVILQPKYSFACKNKSIKNVREIALVVDFYLPKLDLWIDVKGMRKPMDILKKKIFEYQNKKELLFVNKCPIKYNALNKDSMFGVKWIEVEYLDKLRKDDKKEKGGDLY